MKYPPLNHFAFRIPKAIQTSLNTAKAFFARFDSTNRFIATSKIDSTCVIWDLDTFQEVRVLGGHVSFINDISWSRHSRYILTASKDWNCIVWDLASNTEPPQRVRTIRFDYDVIRAVFHPRNSNMLAALLGSGDAYLIDERSGQVYRTELLEIISDSDENGGDGEGETQTRSQMTCIEFDPTGKIIFAGTTQGYILAFRTRTKRMIARHKIASAGPIKQLKISRCGRFLLTNSQDRVIRHFEVPSYDPPPVNSEEPSEYLDQDLDPIYRFADPVDKVQWNGIGYSADSEWVIGGAADAAKHKIYIWDLSQDGILYETIEGGRETVVDVQWHPTRTAMASTSNTGTVILWHNPTLEKWGAFAGDFEELNENVDYIEREDEFDIEDEEELLARKMRAEEEDVDIEGDDDDDSIPEAQTKVNSQGWQDDIRWAEEYPDDDSPDWKLKIIMENDEKCI